MIDLKTVVLCADDFGLSPGISNGILKLVGRERLSAVSCMTNMPLFATYAKELLSFEKQVKIGLHFNLTEGYFVSNPQKACFTLNELLMKTHCRAIKPALIAQELSAQMDQFTQLMQRPPDFIDGHQHVHQFPQIQQIILDRYEQRWKNYGMFIRSTYPSINVSQYQLKARVLGITGGKALQRQLIKSKIPHNDFFSGIYNFAPDTNYRDLFRKWMALIRDNTLIMCHPADQLSGSNSIAAARLKEFNYFFSDEFIDDCEEYRIKLS